ncbi:MAG: hypothetical protein IKB93_07110 [Clostridia bacterium]|nr:hypothetical protein [Clostridia bacterium]
MRDLLKIQVKPASNIVFHTPCFAETDKTERINIELNDAEEECDTLYLMSVHEATKNPEDVFATLSLVKIYDCFEACADACEHVGECVRTVVMKNT